MADNVTLSAGTADGAVVATDDITSVHYQIVKLIIGALNSGTLLSGGAGNVDAGTIRVVIATDQAALNNKLLVTPDLPSGAATSAKQDTIIGHVDGIETLIGTTNTSLTTIDGRVDGIETLLTAIDGHVDGIEGTQASIVTSVQLIDDAIVADDAAFTPATTKVMMAGFEADETATDSVDEGDGGSARMTLDRKQIVTMQPHTTGGLTTFMASASDGSSILVATKQTVKASAGQLYGYYVYNPEAAVTFLHFYNTDTVTVGTTNPQVSFAIPAGAAANLAFPNGVIFDTAISTAATTTAGGNTAPSTGLSLVAWYK